MKVQANRALIMPFCAIVLATSMLAGCAMVKSALNSAQAAVTNIQVTMPNIQAEASAIDGAMQKEVPVLITALPAAVQAKITTGLKAQHALVAQLVSVKQTNPASARAIASDIVRTALAILPFVPMGAPLSLAIHAGLTLLSAFVANFSSVSVPKALTTPPPTAKAVFGTTKHPAPIPIPVS